VLTTQEQAIAEEFDSSCLAGLALDAEELESLEAAWDWDDFFGGVAIGLGAAGVAAGAIGVGVAIT
jgi:hypothetical protein